MISVKGDKSRPYISLFNTHPANRHHDPVRTSGFPACNNGARLKMRTI